MESDARMSTFERAENLRYGHRAKVELPLVAGGQTVGLASIFDDKARDFGDLELLQSLAQVAANALANATLYDELDRSADRMALVGDVSFELSSSLDLDEVLANTAHRLCALADMPCCDLYTLDDERRLTCVVSLVDGETDKRWQGRSFSLEHWSALRSRRRAAHADRHLVARGPAAQRRTSGRCMGEYAETAEIIFPLISKDVVIGVLELLETRGPRTFGEDEIATIAAVCRVAALAIHNAQLYDDIKAPAPRQPQGALERPQRQGLLHPRPRGPRRRLHGPAGRGARLGARSSSAASRRPRIFTTSARSASPTGSSSSPATSTPASGT